MYRFQYRLCAGAAAGAMLAVIGLASGAHAQTTPEPQAGTIGEVIVTAQRRAQAAQDVPIAMTTQTAETLENAGLRSYSDIDVLTPGLQFQAVGAVRVPFLRGVGATTTAAGAEFGVALYVDDVYLPATVATTMAFNNVDSVSVLRGPQGTLFGRNATGGVVQIATRRPGETPRFDATLGYGNHDAKEGSLYASMPLASWVAADIAVFARNVDGGWGRNLATNERVFKSYDRAVRSRWEFTFGPDTELTVTGHYARVKSQAGFASTRLAPGELGQNERYFGGVTAAETGFYDVDLDGWSGNTTQVFGGSARLVQRLGFAEFRSVTAFTGMKNNQWVDFDLTRTFGTYVHIPANEKTYSQEFQLASPSDSESRLQWVTGVYLYRDAAQYDGQLTMVRVPVVFNQTLNTKQNSESWSVFGQIDYKILDTTELTLGIRYNRDHREFNGATRGAPGNANAYAPSSGARTFTAPTYKIGLNHHINDDLMVYISYTTGFKSGFFSTQTIQNVPGQPTVALPVRPEKIKSVEGGFKWVLLDRKLRLNASAFHYDYRDLQLNAFIDNVTRATINVKSAEIYGIDVDSEWRVTEQLSLTLAAEWLHARYEDFQNSPFFRTNPAGGLISFIGDASGNHLASAPDFTATLGANYTVPLAEGELSFNGTAAYNDGFYFEPMNRLHQKAFVLVNGTVKWTAPEGRYEIALWGRNLTNEKVYATGNPIVNGDSMTPREPRTYGVRVGVHY